jgi:DNA-binding transcriptional regulator YiaG
VVQRQRTSPRNPQAQGHVAFLRVNHLSLKSLRTKDYEFEPTTIGEHIKKKRLQLKLTQKQVAKQLGVTEFSVLNWEVGDNQPDDAPILSRVIRFLGYDPLPTGWTIPELLRAKRRELGMGQRELAEHLGVDPKTVLYWEQGGRIGQKRHRRVLADFLEIPEYFTQG